MRLRIRHRAIALWLVFAVATPAPAFDLVDCVWQLFNPRPATQRELLAWQVRRRKVELRPLYREAEFVKKWGAGIGDGTGGYNNGVFRVETKTGPAALKLYQRDPVETFERGFVVQRTLAERGFAPKILGLMTPDEVARLRARPDAPTTKNERGYALLMEEIPGAWNFVKNGDKVPPEARQWDIKAIEKRLREIEATLKELDIIAFDSQPVITPDGKVFLLDLDMFNVGPSPQREGWADLYLTILRRRLGGNAD